MTGSVSSRRRQIRFQTVVSPLIGATAGLVAAVVLLALGEGAPVPWWPFALFAVSLVLYVVLVGRRLAARAPQ